jgi:hypothetical protein
VAGVRIVADPALRNRFGNAAAVHALATFSVDRLVSDIYESIVSSPVASGLS